LEIGEKGGVSVVGQWVCMGSLILLFLESLARMASAQPHLPRRLGVLFLASLSPIVSSLYLHLNRDKRIWYILISLSKIGIIIIIS
jgi:hypothetical protein